MRQRYENWGIPRTTACATAVLIAVAASTQADAMPIDLGNDWDMNWNTTVSVGAMWRAQNPDNKLYTANNGATVGLGGGSGGSPSDANNLNYREGDRVSTLYKVLSEVNVKHDEMGGMLRIKAWHDQALDNESAGYGNQANGYTSHSGLSDATFPNLQRFEGVQLLDAYVYNSFDVANRPLQIRLGRQVINWGESLFIQGVNQINPIDVSALRKPGTEIKEAFLPVWAAYGNLGLGGGASVEAFYQFAWEPTNVDGCGTYWSSVDTGVGVHPGACDKITLGSRSSAADIANGAYAPVIDGRGGRNSGQFGAAVKLPVEAIDTEFGLYAMNVSARTPIISTRTGDWGGANAAQKLALSGGAFTLLNPIMASQLNGAPLGVKTASAYWEYPNDVQYYGVSAATNLDGWSVGAEVSYTPNLPVQRNGNDLLNGMLTGTGPLGGKFAGAGSLSDVQGYDKLQKGQLQVNGIKQFGGILGSAKSTFMGEVALQVNDAPDYKDGTSVRYGRAFIFGTASSAGNNTCNTTNPQSDGCRNDGFVTPFAWGYRMRGELEYPQFMGSPLTFTPSLSIAHDVSGISADNQMIEDRVQTGVNARFSYDNRYSLDMGYVHFADWAKYDPLRDHDFYSLSLSATF